MAAPIGSCTRRGITLVVSRLLHAQGMMQSGGEGTPPGRLIGATATWILITVLAVDNLFNFV